MSLVRNSWGKSTISNCCANSGTTPMASASTTLPVPSRLESRMVSYFYYFKKRTTNGPQRLDHKLFGQQLSGRTTIVRTTMA